uniref:C2H2-type domain-containing protein n=1 Tax=Syphacia muris TaxID=451379 RepID=A0A0N5AM65_9BILA
MPHGNDKEVTKLYVFDSGMECCSNTPAEFGYMDRDCNFLRLPKRDRASLSVKPSILRCQKKCLIFPYATSDIAKYNVTKKIDGDEYVKRLKGRLGSTETYMSTRKITAAQVSDSSVYERLSLRMDCDPRTKSCLMPYCGRTFDSLQVLAWHMSYAHQDLSRTDEQSSLCYLCGYQMQTAKGKNAHLTAKHRSIAFRHNAQCLEQREAVIAPGAPAAERLKQDISGLELVEVPVADSMVLMVQRP